MSLPYEEIWDTASLEGTRAFQEGRYDDAEKHFQTAVSIAEMLWPESPRLATSISNLALLYTSQGKYKQAEPLHRQSLAIVEKARGTMDPEVVPILENYAALLRKTNRPLDAEKLERRVTVIRQRS